jgi:hypothetical protein
MRNCCFIAGSRSKEGYAIMMILNAYSRFNRWVKLGRIALIIGKVARINGIE